MSKRKRAKYTLEFEMEAVRLVQSVLKTLGVAEQTLHNWIKGQAQERAKGTSWQSGQCRVDQRKP